MADFSSGFVGGGLTDARQKYQALNIQRRNAATAEGTLNQNIISSDRNFALEQEKFGELKRSTGVAETAAREAQTRADIERDKKEMESMQVAVTEANEQIRLLYSQTPTEDRHLIQSKVDALKAVVGNVVEVGMKIKPAQAQSWQLRHNKILETPFSANRSAVLAGEAVSAGQIAQVQQVAAALNLPVSQVAEAFGLNKLPPTGNKLTSSLLDDFGNVKPEVYNSLAREIHLEIGGKINQETGELQILPPDLGLKKSKVIRDAMEIIQGGREPNLANAVTRSLQQNGFPINERGQSTANPPLQFSTGGVPQGQTAPTSTKPAASASGGIPELNKTISIIIGGQPTDVTVVGQGADGVLFVDLGGGNIQQIRRKAP